MRYRKSHIWLESQRFATPELSSRKKYNNNGQTERSGRPLEQTYDFTPTSRELVKMSRCHSRYSGPEGK
ncbi:hypothetical protein EYF80_010156 [Liparis tanakae]|uniref:Uncharacterized protein n=1 Tax=Liparis tanakae TaxID=230148 RepID=A0A4Z2IQ00_9TELE|nr:hypothetical protein EYF80_010156 [Liparis tanakae]